MKPDPLSYPPRGMNREEAARYVGVGATLFDAMVLDKRMPQPRRVNTRSVWDRFELDLAFSDLPKFAQGTLEDLAEQHRRMAGH